MSHDDELLFAQLCRIAEQLIKIADSTDAIRVAIERQGQYQRAVVERIDNG